MPPRTSPPTIASRVRMSPSTRPPLATSTWRAARTVPTIEPSTFTTPSAETSPSTRIPVPMIDSPASGSGPERGFSVKIAMSIPFFHDRQRVDRSTLAADLEMQMGRRGATRVAGQSDDLPRLHLFSLADQKPGGVPIHGLIPRGMSQEDVHAVIGIGSRGGHGAAS